MTGLTSAVRSCRLLWPRPEIDDAIAFVAFRFVGKVRVRAEYGQRQETSRMYVTSVLIRHMSRGRDF